MMLLLSVELVEKLGGEACVVINTYGGGGAMVSQCRGVVGQVGVL